MNFQDIFKTYEAELREVEKELINIFKSDATLIPTIGAYIINSGGKGFAPYFYSSVQTLLVTGNIKELSWLR